MINDLTERVRDARIHGVSISLNKGRYQREYRDKPRPKKMSLDSAYGVCFRACLSDIGNTIRQMKGRHTLHIVLEAGHPNVRDACRVFDEITHSAKQIKQIAASIEQFGFVRTRFHTASRKTP